MKKLIVIMMAVAVFGMYAEAQETHPEVADIIAATGWSEEELLLGLTRLDNLYTNDMKTEQGRQRWHGPKVKTVVDADYGLEAITYADGETITLTHPVKTAQQAVTAANKKISVSTRGIPAALAALRKKAAEDAATTNIVNVTIGGK